MKIIGNYWFTLFAWNNHCRTANFFHLIKQLTIYDALTFVTHLVLFYKIKFLTFKFFCMIKMLIVIATAFIALNTNAQLANTNWKGTLNIQGGIDVQFMYGKDTLNVINVEDNSTLETMKYTVKDSLVTIQKISGQSQCDPSSLGKYKFVINNGQMIMTLVSDDCYDRSNAIGKLTLKKV